MFFGQNVEWFYLTATKRILMQIVTGLQAATFITCQHVTQVLSCSQRKILVRFKFLTLRKKTYTGNRNWYK
jgi:hypothetical protein